MKCMFDIVHMRDELSGVQLCSCADRLMGAG